LWTDLGALTGNKAFFVRSTKVDDGEVSQTPLPKSYAVSSELPDIVHWLSIRRENERYMTNVAGVSSEDKYDENLLSDGNGTPESHYSGSDGEASPFLDAAGRRIPSDYVYKEGCYNFNEHKPEWMGIHDILRVQCCN
ncbi:hypothetical protein C5167_013824, partial [Papaver somniferum]